MIENAWLIPLFPLIAFIVLILFQKQLKEVSAWLGVAFTLGAFILAVMTLVERIGLNNAKASPVLVDWFHIGDRLVTMGYEITPLNALMLVIVTTVSLVVHLYSRGYMEGDDRIAVFYAYLGLFTFSMLGLVLSPNLLQLYIFWELVGVMSFLLVGFYYYKPEAKAAAKKAFIMTRIGDVGLLVAIILIFWNVGSFDYAAIFAAVQNNELTGGLLTLIAILIFVGAIGKSGQFPLHTWLPDAMEGPTPVSALIHAATMVAAGVYLVASLFPLFEASPAALNTVAYVGGFTAIFAASIALVQNDIKRILAYSTVSQLGYMMLALGAAGYAAGVFHLMTHAFFKALLFLAAGSVIHALHKQNIQEMGGLFRKMKWTGWLFLIGCLAIVGIPPFSGFFSKEEILLTVWQSGNVGLFWIAVVTAFMTAFYMFRLFFKVFMNAPQQNGLSHIKESPFIMIAPMVALGVLAVGSGWVNTHWFGMYLTNWLETGPAFTYGIFPEEHTWILVMTLLVSLAGIGLAYLMYGQQRSRISPDYISEKVPGMHRLLERKYYVDEVYDVVFVKGLDLIGNIGHIIDKYVIEGFISMLNNIMNGFSSLGAKWQNGQVQVYGTTVLIGMAIIILAFMLTGGYLR